MITELDRLENISIAKELLEEMKERDKNKIPVKIDTKTIILINPDCDMAERKEHFLSITKKFKNNITDIDE